MRIAFVALVALLSLMFAPSGRADLGRTESPAVTEEAKGPVRCVVGISPFLAEPAKNEAFRQLVKLLVQDLPLGSALSVYDAYHLRTVTRFEVPDLRAFRSEKTRVNQFRTGIEELRRFLATDQPVPEVSGLAFAGALRLPQFLDFVAENRPAPDAGLVVVLLGSPLYVDEKEPGFSMVQGRFPSDGHLLAGRDRTVYGLRDRSERLKGIAVHLGYFGDPWVTELHRERILRFWRMFVSGQGGRLGAMAADLPTVFTAVEHAVASVGTEQPDPADAKIEMLRITRDVGASDWITRDRITDPAQGPPARRTGPMKIGIRWQGDVDLDLYARPRPEGERLYFEHARSPDGYYYKDHRSSPDREYEFVEFTEPVEVGQVEVAVNLYGGRQATPGGIGGEVRIEFDGRIYTGRFTIEAERGNRGREGPSQSRWWCPIDVPALLKLR